MGVLASALCITPVSVRYTGAILSHDGVNVIMYVSVRLTLRSDLAKFSQLTGTINTYTNRVVAECLGIWL